MKRRHLAADRGETLIEVLVSVVIMGVAVPAVIGSVLVGVMMAGVHRSQATAGGAVRTYAEKIESYAATTALALPTTAAGYQAAVPFTLTGYTPSVTSVLCWTGSQFANCGSATSVEQLGLLVSSTDGRVAESLVVVVRKP